jgi:hypothetical protein
LRHFVGRQRAVLPAVDQAGKIAAAASAFRRCFGLDQLLQQPDLVVGVEDGEIGFQPDQLGMAAQDLDALIEWKVPSQGRPLAWAPADADALFISRAALLVKVTASIC